MSSAYPTPIDFFKLKLKIYKQQNQPMIFTFLLLVHRVTNKPKIIFLRFLFQLAHTD